MSAIVKEVYDAFRSAGVSDALATAAARAIPLTGELATKGDIGVLRADIDGIRTEIGVLRADIGGIRTEIDGVRTQIDGVRTEVDGVRTEVDAKINGVRAELKGDMKELELRMTIKFYTAVGLAVAGIKSLDFLIG
ncbi:MAG: hypothetical protein OXP28_06850 [Gammaproteobacteria bacterium]|nr:hypothetical protein [Gammaproteobacteria bacterium]MDE0224834.1 hypothetical protein [Gammaproteobacteria bacterium]